MYKFEAGLQAYPENRDRLSRAIDFLRTTIDAQWGLDASTETVFTLEDGMLNARFRYDSEGWRNQCLKTW